MHVWHLSGQEMHEELTKVRPDAHEVHCVIFVGLQLEHEMAQPRQKLFATTNPLEQVKQFVAFEQTIQFLGHYLH